MNPGEEQATCGLVKRIFNEFVAPDYEKDGVEEFFKFANPDAMKERKKSGGFVWLAFQANEPVGMLELVLPDHISLFFTAIQHQGIGIELLVRTISRSREKNPNLLKLTVNSSPYAGPIYLKMGFHKTGDITTDHGITYIPMELSL